MLARSILLACAMVGIAQAAFAQTQEEARNELMRHILNKSDDRQIATGVKTGVLDSKKSYTLAPIAIDPDKDYLLLGACSDECWDLDLEALDEKGRPLDLTEDNDIVEIFEEPVLLVKAGRSGKMLHVKVIMADCKDEPCLWGVGAFLANEQQQ